MNGLIQGVKVRTAALFKEFKLSVIWQTLLLARVVYVVTDSASFCQGSAVIHVCSSDWCAVWCVGEAVLPVGHCLLHLRPDPSDEAQPLVGLTVLCWHDNVNIMQRDTDTVEWWSPGSLDKHTIGSSYALSHSVISEFYNNRKKEKWKMFPTSTCTLYGQMYVDTLTYSHRYFNSLHSSLMAFYKGFGPIWS